MGIEQFGPDFNKSFDRIERTGNFFFKFLPVIWAVCAILGLGLMGFGVWAVYRLVTHFAP